MSPVEAASLAKLPELNRNQVLRSGHLHAVLEIDQAPRWRFGGPDRLPGQDRNVPMNQRSGPLTEY